MWQLLQANLALAALLFEAASVEEGERCTFNILGDNNQSHIHLTPICELFHLINGFSVALPHSML